MQNGWENKLNKKYNKLVEEMKKNEKTLQINNLASKPNKKSKSSKDPATKKQQKKQRKQ